MNQRNSYNRLHVLGKNHSTSCSVCLSIQNFPCFIIDVSSLSNRFFFIKFIFYSLLNKLWTFYILYCLFSDMDALAVYLVRHELLVLESAIRDAHFHVAVDDAAFDGIDQLGKKNKHKIKTSQQMAKFVLKSSITIVWLVPHSWIRSLIIDRHSSTTLINSSVSSGSSVSWQNRCFCFAVFFNLLKEKKPKFL